MCGVCYLEAVSNHVVPQPVNPQQSPHVEGCISFDCAIDDTMEAVHHSVNDIKVVSSGSRHTISVDNPSIQSWKDLSESESVLSEFFEKIQQVYDTSLAGGYKVVFGDSPEKGARVDLYGSRSVGEQLQQYSCRDQFCRDITEGRVPEEAFDETDTLYSAWSLSHQLLVIPKQAYQHWFVTPIDVQMDIFKNAVEKRLQKKDKVEKPMELHCGVPAAQTLPQLHFRTGIYENN